jgi:hypothetical protein
MPIAEPPITPDEGRLLLKALLAGARVMVVCDLPLWAVGALGIVIVIFGWGQSATEGKQT